MHKTVDIERFIRLQEEITKPDTVSIGNLLKGLLKLSRVREKEKMEFCTQLSVMLRSGVSLHRSLDVLELQTKNEKVRSVIQSLRKEIQKGNSFAKALSLQPNVFDDLFVATAEVGQETGRLSEVLSQLGNYLEKIHALKRKFKQALTYPALVLLVAFFAVTFLMVFIVPSFAEMFKSFQIELPLSTQIVLSLSELVNSYGAYLLIVLATLLNVGRNAIISDKLEPTLLRIPYLGGVILKNTVARFCRTLGTMLHAQVSLVEALEITQRVFTNKNTASEIGKILRYVKQGRAVAEPLVESRLFPPMVAQMIAVGEETSELDTMLLKVADYYEKELDTTMETLSSVIEPVIILLLGLLVAAILVSMYLPMFDLVGVVSEG